MYDRQVREAALVLRRSGHTTAEIARRLGVSRFTVRDWIRAPEHALRLRDGRCFVCAGVPCPQPVAYVYLLGQYLGDGHLVTTVRVPRLRVACAQAYPQIADEVDAAMYAVSGNRPGRVRSIGCDDHYAYWMHWPCLFPQHGPGRKHERPIFLAPWQDEIVAAHPWPLIRGLIHSDGCRAINRITVRGRTYCYPRYFFSNESRDILGIMGTALGRVGVAYRYNRPNSISIARRDAVALMDAHVGPEA